MNTLTPVLYGSLRNRAALHFVATLLLLWATSDSVYAADRAVAVSVDCGKILSKSPILWGHVNVSRRAPPPQELCELVEREFGRPRVTRCWLMLDQMWDYRTGAYRFDYEINRDYYADDPHKQKYGVAGHTTGLHFYDYVDAVSAHSDAVMMNIRRYEREVLSGMLTHEKWKEVFKAAVRHYKQRCPNLGYIEVLNEPTARNQSNLGSMENYYGFYRQAYEAINELNAELQPDLPLKVGGCSGFRTDEAIHLIEDFARDVNPEKRLDFVSFHHYWAPAPSEISNWEPEIDRALRKAELPTDIPIFVTEIGYAWKSKTDPQKNLWHAAGMTAYQYQARNAQDLRLFPWVQYHSPSQIAMVQFDTNLRMTPFGAAVKMLRMHGSKEVASQSSGLDKNGNGIGVLATIDGKGLTVHLWNLDPNGSDAADVEVAVSNALDCLGMNDLSVRRYLVDTSHSNCFAAASARGGLEMVAEWTMTSRAELHLSATLEPMALCLWRIEVEGDSSNDSE